MQSWSHIARDSINCAEQFGLENVLVLLVLLARLVGLVVLPPNHLVALLAIDVSHNVPARGHIALHWLARLDVDHV